jgi:hypothetical protein
MVQPEKPQMTIWRKRFACWVTKVAHSQNMYYCFSAARIVTRTRLNITLYITLSLFKIVYFIYHS